MGEIVCSSAALAKDLADLRANSKILNKMLNEILEQGDLTIQVLQQQHSFYDNRVIVLGVQQLPTKLDCLSTLVTEICNAWADRFHQKPDYRQFNAAADYGTAVEKMEWAGCKTHVQILKELAATTSSLGVSRFEQAFEDPKYGWDDFEKYLAFQRASGHTAQIESHWRPGSPK